MITTYRGLLDIILGRLWLLKGDQRVLWGWRALMRNTREVWKRLE